MVGVVIYGGTVLLGVVIYMGDSVVGCGNI